jgi:hypothetical protein
MEVEAPPGPVIDAGISRFDAENATALTADFLKRLGYRGTWLPSKVSIDGELYIVEMTSEKKTAKVQINSATKEIREYEFGQEETASKGSGLTKPKLIFLIAAIAVSVIVTKLLGVF